MSSSGPIVAGEARAAFALAADLAACRRPEDLEAALGGLPSLVGAEYVGAGELRRGGGEEVGVLPQVTQPYVFDADALADWAAHHHQHPVFARLPDARVLSYADFVSDREWRKLGIYSAYRRLGLRGELSLHLAWDERRTAVLTVHRVDRAFGERERELLETLAPHLRAAYARLEEGQEARRWRAALEDGLAHAGACVVIADAEGRIVDAGGGAEAVLGRWFEARQAPGSLPAELIDWVGEARASAPAPRLSRAMDGRRLEVTLAGATAEERLLVMREWRVGPADPAELAAALPVTRRQAEVLALLADGRSDAEIAHRLGISVRTVGHHVEHILDRLEVGNRTAAARVVHLPSGRLGY
ncbi:MAG: response regulator transcription factor [Actinobacteria bacterium]|nr:response regulator transcription factor [Actinomycetota bacterium]